MRLTLSGTHLTNSLPPNQFRLNGQPCAATVVTNTTTQTGDTGGTVQAVIAEEAKPENKPARAPTHAQAQSDPKLGSGRLRPATDRR